MKVNKSRYIRKIFLIEIVGLVAIGLYSTSAQAGYVKITDPKIARHAVSVCFKDRNNPVNCGSTSQKRVADKICVTHGYVRARDWKKGFVAIPSPMKLLTKRTDGRLVWQNVTRMDPFSWVYCESIYTQYNKPEFKNHPIDKCFGDFLGQDWGNSTKRCDGRAQRFIARHYCKFKGHKDVKSWKIYTQVGYHYALKLKPDDYFSGRDVGNNTRNWLWTEGLHAFSQIVCQ